MNKITQLLSYRSHTIFELRRKLRQREYSPELIEEAIRKAVEYKWLDDVAATEQYINEQKRKGGHGRCWIEARLIDKGISRKIIDSQISKMWTDDIEKKLIYQLFNKLLSTNKGKTKQDNLKNRVYRAAMNRGFNSEISLLVFEEINSKRDREH
ncbi:MAG: RecX family transcriptional regulator [Candidatus Electryonea clarkiae]|nr:RecX family transcriptional regulator [Candidatus Electryonea clarkiae]MDP8286663.1 RecX family transcriptional regulator [Candidatus Electryonea clarkiae]